MHYSFRNYYFGVTVTPVYNDGFFPELTGVKINSLVFKTFPAISSNL